MVWMGPIDAIRYPRLWYFCRFELYKVKSDKKKWTAFLKYSEFQGRWFGSFQAMMAVGYGNPPKVNVKKLKNAFGEFEPGKNSNTVHIDSGWAKRFEKDHKKAAARQLMEATILHEMVHWGDDMDGKDQAGEEGLAFERAAYGKVIGKYW